MESPSHQSFTLNNGLIMPGVGLGTYRILEKEPIVKAILEAGYRHIDTAFVYDNEHIVGDAIQEVLATGKVKREELFVVTKIRHTQYDDVEGAIREALKKLKLDYVDLFLIHWPAGFFAPNKKPLHKLWAEHESLVDKGLAKSLGLSNFNV